MRLTKYTHACVRLEKDGKVLVLDPGIWAEPEALDGADAVLVTHEHSDHVDADRLRASGVPTWANAGVAGELDADVTVVDDGQSFEAAGFSVRAYGRDHAVILPELGVPCQNTAFLVEDAVFHPGDSWTRPDRAVHTNLVPLGGPWFVMADAVEYARSIEAQRTVNLHDAPLSERGLALARNWIGGQGGKPYEYLAPGSGLDIE
jgi:L-ascorbate metabolism protein UlaG (beta-lactamase superfamily)